MDYEIAFYVKNRAKYEREKTAPLSGAKLYPYKVDMATLTDYYKMKDKLVMDVVSAETNKDLPETVPHKDIEDMAVVYRFVLSSDVEGWASILATNQMIENFGITAEQLHADALEI